jgi:hypothetical protein
MKIAIKTSNFTMAFGLIRMHSSGGDSTENKHREGEG